MLFYFYGENSFAISKEVERIKRAYIKKTGSDGDMETFDMSARPLSDLLNSLSVMPMFVSSRLLVVRDLHTHKLQKEELEKLLASVSKTTNIIFLDSQIDKRSAHFKTLSNLKNAKNFHSLPPLKLVNWVEKTVGQKDGRIDKRTINVLIEKVGNDQWQLNQEIKKLVAYSPKINEDSIEKLVVPNLNYSAFNLADKIITGNSEAARKIYLSLIKSGEPDQKIFGAVVYSIRNIMLARVAIEEKADWQRDFKVSPYGAKTAEQQARRLDLEQVREMYTQLVDCDYMVKSGQKESTQAMQDLIYSLSLMFKK